MVSQKCHSSIDELFDHFDFQKYYGYTRTTVL